MSFRSDRIALTARWALLATMLIGTVICVVNAATNDSDRPELQELLEQYAATGQSGQTGDNPGAKRNVFPTDYLIVTGAIIMIMMMRDDVNYIAINKWFNKAGAYNSMGHDMPVFAGS